MRSIAWKYAPITPLLRDLHGCGAQLSTRRRRRSWRRRSEPHVPADGLGSSPVDTPGRTRGLKVVGDTWRSAREQADPESRLFRHIQSHKGRRQCQGTIHVSRWHSGNDISAARNSSASSWRHGRLVRVGLVSDVVHRSSRYGQIDQRRQLRRCAQSDLHVQRPDSRHRRRQHPSGSTWRLGFHETVHRHTGCSRPRLPCNSCEAWSRRPAWRRRQPQRPAVAAHRPCSFSLSDIRKYNMLHYLNRISFHFCGNATRLWLSV